MGDSTISQLPSAPTVNPSDVVPIDQGGVTKRATVQQLTAAVSGLVGSSGAVGLVQFSAGGGAFSSDPAFSYSAGTLTVANVSGALTGTAALSALSLTGVGARITGDFTTSATPANRVMFKSSTTDGATNVSAVPNGTGRQSSFVGYTGETANESYASVGVNAIGGRTEIVSGYIGSGTAYPMVFYTNNTEAMRIDTSGNLTFNTAAQRILGDFSNATLASRTMFQDKTTNNNTAVSAVPNGSATVSSFEAYNAATPTNSGVIQLYASSTDGGLIFDKKGSGSYLPMTFYTGGAERMRIDTSGNVGVGVTPGGTAKLEVAGNAMSFQYLMRNFAGAYNGTTQGFHLFGFSDNNLYIDWLDNGAFVFRNNGTTEKARLDSTGTLSVVPGTAVAPAYAFNPLGTYGGTGMFSPGANTVAFSTVGGERMRIDSSGNVGIGGTASAAKLAIKDGGAGQIELQNGTGTVKAWIGTSSIIGASATDALRIRGDAGIDLSVNGARYVAVDTNGNLLQVGASGLGYGTGSGGTVTQATSKSTAVTLNRPTGQITTATDNLNANTTVFFTFNNSLLAATDTLVVHRAANGSGASYLVWCDSVSAGSAVICIRNITAGALNEFMKINFNVLKGATA